MDLEQCALSGRTWSGCAGVDASDGEANANTQRMRQGKDFVGGDKLSPPRSGWRQPVAANRRLVKLGERLPAAQLRTAFRGGDGPVPSGFILSSGDGPSPLRWRSRAIRRLSNK